MSFIKKMFAKIGIGNIDVDTQFHTKVFIPGEFVEGVIAMKGGSVEQRVEKLYIQLKTEYMKPVMRDSDGDGKAEEEDQRETINIADFIISEQLVLAPGERVEIPFEFMLPHETPMSIRPNRTWIYTGVDIDHAIDPTDSDYIEIQPHRYAQVVFQALVELGFKMREANNKYYVQVNHPLPFIQEFEYVPISTSPYKRTIDELEFVLYPSEYGIEVMLELDRKARGLRGYMSEMMDKDETCHRISFNSDELEEGPSSIANQFRRIFDSLL